MVLGEETLEGLMDNPQSLTQIAAMARHYKLDKINPDQPGPKLDFSHIVANVSEGSRDKVMTGWKKICGSDDNCLQDYVRLFLRQLFKLREQNIKALFSSI